MSDDKADAGDLEDEMQDCCKLMIQTMFESEHLTGSEIIDLGVEKFGTDVVDMIEEIMLSDDDLFESIPVQ